MAQKSGKGRIQNTRFTLNRRKNQHALRVSRRERRSAQREEPCEYEDPKILQLEELQAQMQKLVFALLNRMIKIREIYAPPNEDRNKPPVFTPEMEKWMSDVNLAYAHMNSTIRSIENKGITESITEYTHLISIMNSCVYDSRQFVGDMVDIEFE